MSTSAPAAAPRAGCAPPTGTGTGVPTAAPPRPRRTWPRRLLLGGVAGLLAAGLLFGMAGPHSLGPAAAPPAATSRGATGTAPTTASTAASLGGGPVGTAVAALVAPGGSDPAAAVPPGFASFRGYTPVPERLSGGTVRMTNPDGDCSVPGGGTRFRFDAACRAHDYGYDLLRYAAATGEPLPDDARRLIDGMFARGLDAHCDATRSGLPALGCHATAGVFTTGVVVNSWRQGYGNPVDETLPAWPLAAAPVAAVPLLVLLQRGRTRRATTPLDAPGTRPSRDSPPLPGGLRVSHASARTPRARPATLGPSRTLRAHPATLGHRARTRVHHHSPHPSGTGPQVAGLSNSRQPVVHRSHGAPVRPRRMPAGRRDVQEVSA